MRKSLSLKDDDYRLSFLYGNFTTLTRFTEADLERVVTEQLSPLYVSIHATDPELRARLLRNRRGATSLRWLAALLDAGIEVHGQVVVCPGINDGDVLDDTLLGVLDRFPRAGDGRRRAARRERPHHRARDAPAHPGRGGAGPRHRRRLAGSGSSTRWAGASSTRPTSTTCWPAGRSRPSTPTTTSPSTRTASAWPRSSQREVRAELAGRAGRRSRAPAPGSSPGSTAPPPRATARRRRAGESVATGRCRTRCRRRPRRRSRHPHRRVRRAGARRRCADDLAAAAGAPVRVRARRQPVLRRQHRGHRPAHRRRRRRALVEPRPPTTRYLLPDVVLSNGRFLDGTTPADLPRPVEIVATDGASLVAGRSGHDRARSRSSPSSAVRTSASRRS